MSLYESDFYAWTRQQATLLRDGKLAQADIEKIAEEIDSMGRGERRELENRLTVLMLHLLKWRYQPALRGNSGRFSVMELRRRIERHLRQNPSLRANLPETILDAYGDALIEAARETGLDPSGFPQTCPWVFDDMMAPTFWPEA